MTAMQANCAKRRTDEPSFGMWLEVFIRLPFLGRFPDLCGTSQKAFQRLNAGPASTYATTGLDTNSPVKSAVTGGSFKNVAKTHVL
jgi:hypothetical protein